MGVPGIPELLIIGGIIILLFGAKKLPHLGGAIGESIKNFRKGVKEGEKEDTKSIDEPKDVTNKEGEEEKVDSKAQ